MRRLLALIAALLLLPASPAGAQDDPVPPAVPGAELVEAPPVTAAAWLVHDDTYDIRLGARRPDERRSIASTTKIMTALVVVGRSDPEEDVVVSEEAAAVGESEIGLVPGETLSVRQLLVAMLVGSANDAAMALAEHVGGSVDAFVELMNRRALQMGLENTHFANPHGLDEAGHYSSAADLLAMAREFMRDPLLAELAGTRAVEFPPTPAGRSRVAEATNELLRTYPGAIGVKTGFTGQAGLTLVAAAEQDGRRVYSVVLGSEDHFADSAVLLEMAFEAFGPVRVLTAGRDYATYRKDGTIRRLPAVEGESVFMATDAAGLVRLDTSLDASGPSVRASLQGEELAWARLADPPVVPLPAVREAAAWASVYWDHFWGTR